MTAPRAWARPDGTLVVRDPHNRYGSDVTWLSASDPDPSDATPLVAAPKVDGDDLRVAILDEAIGYALDNDGERTPSARLLLARLDAAAPVVRGDMASPDEDGRTAPCPDCGADVEVLDSIPSLAPVIDDHTWLGVLCSGSGAAAREAQQAYVERLRAPAPAPAPLQPGDEVTGDRAVAAPIDTTLRCTTAAVVALRTVNGWSLTGWTAEADPEHHVRVNTWRVVEVGAGGGES